MRPHEPVQRPQVGELLPAVARHLGEQRALPVHDLVVGERQHEVLAERVDEAERDVVLVMHAVDGIALEVLEREQIRDSGHPRVRWLGHDHVELLVRGVNEIAAVVRDHSQAGIDERMVVDVVEMAGRFDHRWFEFDA